MIRAVRIRALSMAGLDGLERHQILLFSRQCLVDLLDHSVGQFLDLILSSSRLVLADFLFFQEILDIVIGIATNISDRDSRIFRF